MTPRRVIGVPTASFPKSNESICVESICVLIGRLYAPSRTKPLSTVYIRYHTHKRFSDSRRYGQQAILSEPCRQSEEHILIILRTTLQAPLHWLLNARKQQAMLSKICFAYAILSEHAFRAVLSGSSQMENRRSTSPMMLTVPENMSAAATNATDSDDLPTKTQPSLGNGTQQESNRSSSTNDLPFGNDLPMESPHALRCNSHSYGTDLNRGSCLDAWVNLGRTPDTVRWGPRVSAQSSPYRLPYRWSSGT